MPNTRQLFDQQHLRAAVVPVAVKCERRGTTIGATNRTGRSLCHQVAFGRALPRWSRSRQLNGNFKSLADCGPE